jgi:nucleoside-diphosphate-sugar epimerase
VRILVTGGAGFIGANLVAELLRLGHTVKVLDNFSTGHRSNLPALDDVELIEGDLRSYERVHRAVQGCEVFHQGALPSVPRSVQREHVAHAWETTSSTPIRKDRVA